MRVIPAKTYVPTGVAPADRDYELIKVRIMGLMVGLSGMITAVSWLVYGLKIGVSYLLGACAGMVYFRMLARSVDRLGNGAGGIGAPRLAIFIAVMIVALRWDQLAVLPVFLGFVTYKAAILLYAMQDLIRSSHSR